VKKENHQPRDVAWRLPLSMEY